MARKNPFDPKVKKAEREAKKDKRIADLRKKATMLHKEALASEKAIDDHERNIGKERAGLEKQKRAESKAMSAVEKLEKQLAAAKRKYSLEVTRTQAISARITRMHTATDVKQKRCDGKFKRFNSAEDQLAKLTKLKLPKDM